MLNKLTPEQIQKKVAFIKNYISADNAADGSLVDPNANVTRKTVDWKISKGEIVVKQIKENWFSATCGGKDGCIIHHTNNNESEVIRLWNKRASIFRGGKHEQGNKIRFGDEAKDEKQKQS